jgi:hypothetical protein
LSTALSLTLSAVSSLCLERRRLAVALITRCRLLRHLLYREEGASSVLMTLSLERKRRFVCYSICLSVGCLVPFSPETTRLLRLLCRSLRHLIQWRKEAALSRDDSALTPALLVVVRSLRRSFWRDGEALSTALSVALSPVWSLPLKTCGRLLDCCVAFTQEITPIFRLLCLSLGNSFS